MNNSNKNLQAFYAAVANSFKTFFTKNLALKIISFLFAFMIWGYVMLETNPERTKIVTEVPVSFAGEADLNSRGLAIRGDKDQILKSVTVMVNTELTNYSGLDAADITASVNLRTVSKPDTYRLRINATTSQGTVLSVTPSELVIEVDQLATRVVPIEVEYSGALPEGYWMDDPVLGSHTVSVSGPEDDVSRVVKAICTINLNERISTFNESVLFKYVDKDNKSVDEAPFLNKLPSVIVKQEVQRMATLNVDVAKAVMGTDALPPNFEVYDIVVTPPAVRVVGRNEVIEKLTSIDIESVDVSGLNASLQAEQIIIIPEGVTLLDGSTVNVYVDIREKLESVSFNGLAIEVRGLKRGYTATLSQQSGDISLTGRASLIRKLERGQVELYVDLSGLEPGQHLVDVGATLPTTEMQTELERTMVQPQITVTISE